MNFNLFYKGQLLLIEAIFCHQKRSELATLRAPGIAKKCNFFSFFNSGNCRVLAFPSYFLIADKCLEGHTFLIVQGVPDMGLCELLCYNKPNCVSVNYEIQGQRRCELNNSTHRAHDRDFKKREGCLYHGAIVSFLSFLFSSTFSFIIIIFMAIIIPPSTSSSLSQWLPSSSLEGAYATTKTAWRKRLLKSEFTLYQNLSFLFHVVQLVTMKC